MQEQTYLSEEGYEKLKKELEELKTVQRKEISQRIEEAKKLGDLSENSEYMEAKEALEFNERKIAEMEALFRNVAIISKDRKKGIVEIGASVTVKMDGKKVDFTIVGSEEADPTAGKISNRSPIGSAFLNKKVGDIAEVHAPKGIIKYEIIDIK